MSNKIKNTITLNGKRYVCKIYDTPEYKDRYTVVFKAIRYQYIGLCYPYVGCSEHGSYYHGEIPQQHLGEFKNLGKRVAFNDVPEAVQKVIINELTGK